MFFDSSQLYMNLPRARSSLGLSSGLTSALVFTTTPSKTISTLALFIFEPELHSLQSLIEQFHYIIIVWVEFAGIHRMNRFTSDVYGSILNFHTFRSSGCIDTFYNIWCRIITVAVYRFRFTMLLIYWYWFDKSPNESEFQIDDVSSI